MRGVTDEFRGPTDETRGATDETRGVPMPGTFSPGPGLVRRDGFSDRKRPPQSRYANTRRTAKR